MADGLPPPPYSLNDPNATPSQSTSNSIQLTPANIRSNNAATSSDDAHASGNSEDIMLAMSATPYFAMRPPPQQTPRDCLAYHMTINPDSSPENTLLPQQWTKFLERGVDSHDWSTFLNYLFPLHDFEHNSRVMSRKGFVDEKSSNRLQKPRSEGCARSACRRPQGHPGDADRSKAIFATIKEWNTGFFVPRGIFISATVVPLSPQSTVDLDARSSGETALYKAVSKGNVNLVRELLSKGANPNTKNYGGRSPLYQAASRKDRAILELLLQYGAIPDGKPPGSASALQIAASTSDIETVQLLLNYGANVDSASNAGHTALYDAVVRSDRTLIALLLEHGANPDKKPWGALSPLSNAVGRSDSHVVELLLSYGANPEAKPWGGHTPLYTAGSRGDKQIVALLLAKGANPEASPAGVPTVLCEAVGRGDVEVVEMLLAHGADVNAKNWGGESPLGRAVGRGNEQMLRLLLEYAGPGDQERGEMVAQMRKIAVDQGKVEIVERLLGQ